MKTRFRVIFESSGWIIQYRTNIFNIFWSAVGVYRYQTKKEALEVMQDLKNGSAEKLWSRKIGGPK